MDKKCETLMDNAIEKFTIHGVDAKGVVVCDKSGLVLTSKDVSISPGPVACLADLAATLIGQRATVCLENHESQVIIQKTDKAVVAVYTNNATWVTT